MFTFPFQDKFGAIKILTYETLATDKTGCTQAKQLSKCTHNIINCFNLSFLIQSTIRLHREIKLSCIEKTIDLLLSLILQCYKCIEAFGLV